MVTRILLAWVLLVPGALMTGALLPDRTGAYLFNPLAIFRPVPLAAQQPDDEARTVTVSATGIVEREPEQAVVTVAVETFAPTASEAAAQNAEQMEALVQALERQGISQDLIRTVGYSIHPEYDREARPEPGEPRIVGYRAINRVRITVDPLARTGAVVDSAIEAGANRVEGLAFQLRDPEAARLDALREAVTKARTEAQALAAAAAQRLGPLVALSTGAGPPRPLARSSFDTAELAAAAVTPVEPGTMEISATVTAVYALVPQ